MPTKYKIWKDNGSNFINGYKYYWNQVKSNLLKFINFMDQNEKILDNIIRYISYLKSNFEIAQSYYNMLVKTNNIEENKLKLITIQNLLECLEQKLFNNNEINYNINTIKDNYDYIIANYLNLCNLELNDIFNYLESNFKLKTIRF